MLHGVVLIVHEAHYTFCVPRSVNMVHLDIKPENVLLTESGIPKLCDFDTAMKIGSEPVRAAAQ